MKIELRVPTDQYAYIGIDLLDNEVLTDEKIQTAVADYKRVVEAVKPQPISDINSSEWIKLYDTVAKGEAVVGDPGTLSQLNSLQKFALNEAKKRIKRLKNN